MRKIIPWTDRVPTSKQRSTKQEKRVAKKLGGRLQPRSGAGDFQKADVLMDGFLVECKTTKAASYVLKLSTLMEVHSQAFEANCRDPLFVVTFEGGLKTMAYNRSGNSDWAILPLDVLKGLIDVHKAKHSPEKKER